MSKPKRIEYGEHKGKASCTQYACKNNYGIQTGIIHESTVPSSCCKLENPRISEFDNGTWGCSDERYGNEASEENTNTTRRIDVDELNRIAEENGLYGNKVTDYLPRKI